MERARITISMDAQGNVYLNKFITDTVFFQGDDARETLRNLVGKEKIKVCHNGYKVELKPTDPAWSIAEEYFALNR